MAKDKILEDHQRHKKKLIPPLLEAFGDKYSPYSWAQELVPELVWISLLIEMHGLKKGVDLAHKLAKITSQKCKADPKPFFANSSSFLSLSPSEKKSIDEGLDPETKKKLNSALRPLLFLCPKHPLRFLAKKRTSKIKLTERSTLNKTLKELYDRNSRTSTFAMATAISLGIAQNKIIFAGELIDQVTKNFEAITDYPNSEASKRAASSFRASAPMFLMSDDDGARDPKSEEWQQYFWSRVRGFGPCLQNFPIQAEEKLPKDNLGRIIFTYRNDAKLDLAERLQTWKYDLNAIEKYEVIGALLARQTTLATEIAIAPTTWTPNIAPMLLRSMADVYIATAWILEEPDKRAKRFIDDGLGAVKLEIAHRKNGLEEIRDRGEKEKARKTIEYWEKWLQSQRMDQFIEVNLGSWSGISTRKMAEEAGCLDFYNYVYQPFSAAVHSNWGHISDKNTEYCRNPAHRFHKIPVVLDFNPDAHWFRLAAKYLQKTFDTFDKSLQLKVKRKNAYKNLIAMLNDYSKRAPSTSAKE